MACKVDNIYATGGSSLALTVGTVYTLSGTATKLGTAIEAVCLSMNTETNVAVMQSYGFGSGTPVGTNLLQASSYNTTTGNFILFDIQLPTGGTTANLVANGISNQSSLIKAALRSAAYNSQYFGATYNGAAWLGNYSGNSCAYYAYSYDSIVTYSTTGGSFPSCVIAPSFKLVLNNVEVSGTVLTAA